MYWQNGRLRDDVATERANVAAAVAQVEILNNTVLMLENQRAEDQAIALKLSEEMSHVRLSRQQEKLELDSYRGRLKSASLGRPTLIGRRATTAFAGVQRDFEAASGGDPHQTD
jgi:hypothetical protein